MSIQPDDDSLPVSMAHIRHVKESAYCLADYSVVQSALSKMAEDITRVLSSCNPIIISMMNGGLVTTGYLLTRLDFPLQLDSVHATRYQGQTQGVEEIVWHKRITLPIQGRHLLLVDDVLDGGITLAHIIADCRAENPASIHTAVLVDKQGNRSPKGLSHADFVGLTLGREYIFGFGMDYHEYLRNLPGIYTFHHENGRLINSTPFETLL